MKFIKLTEVHGNNEIKPIYINFAHVQSFSVGMKGKDTHIRMYDKSFFFVKEKIEEIAKMLNPMPEIAAKEYKRMGGIL
jgi:hypothetical protein